MVCQCEIGQPVGVLVSGAQGVADLELRKVARHRFRALVQRHKVGMLDAILAEHLHAYRTTLEQHRAQLRQGQKVLDGYGGPATSPSPRLVDRSS